MPQLILFFLTSSPRCVSMTAATVALTLTPAAVPGAGCVISNQVLRSRCSRRHSFAVHLSALIVHARTHTHTRARARIHTHTHTHTHTQNILTRGGLKHPSRTQNGSRTGLIVSGLIAEQRTELGAPSTSPPLKQVWKIEVGWGFLFVFLESCGGGGGGGEEAEARWLWCSLGSSRANIGDGWCRIGHRMPTGWNLPRRPGGIPRHLSRAMLFLATGGPVSQAFAIQSSPISQPASLGDSLPESSPLWPLFRGVAQWMEWNHHGGGGVVGVVLCLWRWGTRIGLWRLIRHSGVLPLFLTCWLTHSLVHANTYARMHAHTHTHVRKRTHTYASAHYTHTHTHTHTHTQALPTPAPSCSLVPYFLPLRVRHLIIVFHLGLFLSLSFFSFLLFFHTTSTTTSSSSTSTSPSLPCHQRTPSATPTPTPTCHGDHGMRPSGFWACFGHRFQRSRVSQVGRAGHRLVPRHATCVLDVPDRRTLQLSISPLPSQPPVRLLRQLRQLGARPGVLTRDCSSNCHATLEWLACLSEHLLHRRLLPLLLLSPARLELCLCCSVTSSVCLCCAANVFCVSLLRC